MKKLKSKGAVAAPIFPPTFSPKFSKESLEFLATAGKQKKSDWLDRHESEFGELIVQPLRHLVATAAERLKPIAPGYRFPSRTSPRLKLSSFKADEADHALKSYAHVTIHRPSGSRFDLNPSLYFSFSPERIFVGAGIYKPSSRQINQLREWFAEDPSELEALLKDRTFKKHFSDGLDRQKMIKTRPRFYPADHANIELLKLQAYIVTRSYSKKEFYSQDFVDLVIDDWKQALRFNTVLSSYLSKWPNGVASSVSRSRPEEEEPDDDAVLEKRSPLWDERL